MRVRIYDIVILRKAKRYGALREKSFRAFVISGGVIFAEQTEEAMCLSWMSEADEWEILRRACDKNE